MNFFSRRNQILLKELVKTDFKLRYQGSVIGYLWSILKPLLLFVILYVVFVRVMKFGANVPHFAVGLLLAITLWNFFGEAAGMGMQAIVSHGDLLRKLNFSKSIIIASVICNALINLLITLAVVIIFSIINGVHYDWHVILVVPLLIELIVLAFGVALLLATAFVRFRDIGPIWEVFMQAFFYGTPVIYPITQFSDHHLSIARLLMLNPMAQIIQDMRFALTNANLPAPIPTLPGVKAGVNTNPTIWELFSKNVAGLMPGAPASTHSYLIIVPYILPFIILALGIWVFNRSSKKFAEIL